VRPPKRYIKTILAEVLAKMGFTNQLAEKTLVSLPRNPKWGDYSTNCGFLMAENRKEDPRKVSEEIALAIPAGTFERVDVESGFINFTLNTESLFKFAVHARESGLEYGRSDEGQGRSILIEFVSANPTGPLVVANARAAAIGDSLVRIFNHYGYRAESEFYVDDAGRQVEMLALSVEARLRQLLGEDTELPADGYGGDYVMDLARNLKEGAHTLISLEPSERLSQLKEFALREMLGQQRTSLELFGVKFDNWSHESSFRSEEGTGRLLEELKKKGDMYEDGGAHWFRSTNYGDERDRVLKKSNGDLTYLVADSAYHRDKFDRGYDRILNLFGPDHIAQVPSLRAVLTALGYPGEKIEVLIVQWVTLIRGEVKLSMSKRGGTFITMDEIVEEVGRDASRFFFLMRKPSSHLDFDIDLAKKTSDENPVYYVQYAHARICSVLRFAQEKNISLPSTESTVLSLLREAEERELMSKIASFGDIVADCVEDLSPHRIPFYLQELASSFHNFYHKHRVVTEDLRLSQARLFLCDAVRATIAAGLHLIGVSAPEKM
jgi:arginyl-tRNA synthetase